MYDLHSHILPGLDDGAETLEDAVEMARIAAQHGTKVILATPHYSNVSESSSLQHIQDVLATLRGELEKKGIELEVLMGMENHLDLNLPENFSKGWALAINESHYVLVELPFFGHPNYASEVLFQLQVRGVTPILAHPERAEAVQQDPDLLANFVERGMLSQVTAASILGHFGRRVERFTHMLLRRGLVHIIASDSHSPKGSRSPDLSAGVEATARIVGREKALAMVVDTPRAVIYDMPVDVEPIMTSQRPRPWWRIKGQ